MPSTSPIEPLLWTLLGAVLLPVWLLAGLADHLVHARTRIAETSGVRESVLHVMQTMQIGVPLLAVLFLEVNALVLVLALAGVLAHTVTAFVDIRYTLPLRRIPAAEQFVHAFLIALPFMALAVVVLLHWSAFVAVGSGDADWVPRWKRDPFPVPVTAWVLGGSLLLGVLPGVIELTRTLRHGPMQGRRPRK